MTRPWLFLFLGIVSEVTGTTGMRALVFSHPMLSQTVATLGIVASYFCVSRSVEKIPMGVAYAIWSGVGIVLVSAVAYFWQGQKLDAPALAGMAMIVGGVLVINIFSKTAGH